MSLSPAELFSVNRARAASKGLGTNPRNLEFIWYGFWNRAAFRIASEVDCQRLNVCPQYPLWRLWTKDDNDLGDIQILDDNGIATVEDYAMGSSMDEDSDEDCMDIAADISITTIGETLSIKTRSRITDFAVVWWDESNPIDPETTDEADDHVFLISKELIPIIIEIKRAPSRSLQEDAFNESLDNSMSMAQADAFRQALYFFSNRRWVNQKSLMVIAAVGEAWTYTVVNRAAVSKETDEANEADPEWEPEASRHSAMDWSKAVIWGSNDGKSEYEIVVKWLEEYFLKVEVGDGE